MAIAMEFYNIVIPKAVIAANYPGGIDQYKKDCGPAFLEDEYLTRGGAMNMFDVDHGIRHLQQFGIRYLDEQGKSVDIVVVDMQKGPMTPCDWIEFDDGMDRPRCWLRGTPPGPLSKPDRPDDYQDTIIKFQATNGTIIPVWKTEVPDGKPKGDILG